MGRSVAVRDWTIYTTFCDLILSWAFELLTRSGCTNYYNWINKFCFGDLFRTLPFRQQTGPRVCSHWIFNFQSCSILTCLWPLQAKLNMSWRNITILKTQHWIQHFSITSLPSLYRKRMLYFRVLALNCFAYSVFFCLVAIYISSRQIICD